MLSKKERSRPELLYRIGAGHRCVAIDQRILAVVTLGEVEPEVPLEKVMQLPNRDRLGRGHRHAS